MSAFAVLVNRACAHPPVDQARRMVSAIEAWAGEFGASVGAPHASAATCGPADSASAAARDDVLVAFEGRLGNRELLRREIGAPAAASDAEIVLACHARWGAQMLGHLDGDYALAVWSAADGSLLAARDAFGVRPLYYAVAGHKLFIASQLESILATGEVEPVIDETHVLEYLAWDLRTAEATIYRNIRRVLPGHYLRMGKASPVQMRHWAPTMAPTAFDDEREYQIRFRDAFRRAVEDRLASSHPVVVQLSGGLDSAAIAGMADSVTRAKPSGFPAVHVASALYPGYECDEQDLIESATRRLGFAAHTWDGTASTPIRFTRTSPWSAWPAGDVAGDIAIARRLGARVILSGSGGDELAYEFGVFRDLGRTHRWWTLLRETLFAPNILSEPRTSYFAWRPRLRHFSEGLKGALGPTAANLYRRARSLRQRPLEPWFGPALRSAAKCRPPAEPRIPSGAWVPASTWLALTSPTMCFAVDAAQDRALKSGLELRFPLLDAKLAEFVLRIPLDHRLPHGEMRRLQRRSLGDVLPSEISGRRTVTSFGAMHVAQIRRMLPALRQVLWGRDWHSAPFVDQLGARELFGELSSGGFGLERWKSFHDLRDIVALELWLRAGDSVECARGDRDDSGS